MKPEFGDLQDYKTKGIKALYSNLEFCRMEQIELFIVDLFA